MSIRTIFVNFISNYASHNIQHQHFFYSEKLNYNKNSNAIFIPYVRHLKNAFMFVFCWTISLKTARDILHLLNFLFVWGSSSHSRTFHSNRDVTITGEGLQILTYVGFFTVAHLPWHRSSVYNGHHRGPVRCTYNCCRAFGNGAVTTRFINYLKSDKVG